MIKAALMLLKMLTLALTLVGALLVTPNVSVLAAEPASAGALVIDVDQCTDFYGTTHCLKAKGTSNLVITPSGNTSYVTIYRQESSIIANGQVIWQSERNQRLHSLTIDDVEQQMSQAASYQIPLFGQTYCVEYHVQRSNNELRFWLMEFAVCS